MISFKFIKKKTVLLFFYNVLKVFKKLALNGCVLNVTTLLNSVYGSSHHETKNKSMQENRNAKTCSFICTMYHCEKDTFLRL